MKSATVTLLDDEGQPRPTLGRVLSMNPENTKRHTAELLT
jgi:hypothetical protein